MFNVGHFSGITQLLENVDRTCSSCANLRSKLLIYFTFCSFTCVTFQMLLAISQGVDITYLMYLMYWSGALKSCRINLCVISMREHKFIYVCAFFYQRLFWGAVNVYKRIKS